MPSQQLCFYGANPGRNLAQLSSKNPEHVACQLRQSIVSVRQELEKSVDVAHTAAGHNTKLGKVRPDRADQTATLPDQEVARTVEQQCRLLLSALDRYKAHRRPLDGLADRFR